MTDRKPPAVPRPRDVPEIRVDTTPPRKEPESRKTPTSEPGPRKRIGRPEDMAGAAIFLASRASDYIVGETIKVDGGIVNTG